MARFGKIASVGPTKRSLLPPDRNRTADTIEPERQTARLDDIVGQSTAEKHLRIQTKQFFYHRHFCLKFYAAYHSKSTGRRREREREPAHLLLKPQAHKAR